MEKIIKNINNFLNNGFDADKEAENIMRYILHKTTTNEAMQIFNKLEFKFMEEMKEREREAARVCRAVNSKYPKNDYLQMKVNDPIFERPITISTT